MKVITADEWLADYNKAKSLLENIYRCCIYSYEDNVDCKDCPIRSKCTNVTRMLIKYIN